MALREDISDKFKSLGLVEKDISKKLPKNLAGGWAYSQSKLSNGNTLVEYVRSDGQPFPVCFVAHNAQDARAMMVAWLAESGEV